jgi:nucleoside-diphosphate-sugar epimerase
MARNGLRIAITGAGGYLGSSLCRYFYEHGASVFQLTGSPQAVDKALPATLFSLARGVTRDYLAKNEIDVLVHTAYDFGVSSRQDIWDRNVKGSIALFAQAQHEGVKQVVFVSTMSAYTGCRSLYGQAKLEVENALSEMQFGYSVRPGLLYSTPLAKSGGMINSMLDRVQRGGVLPLIGDGRQKLYLTHVEDLARFIEHQATQSERVAGNGYFITANPNPYEFRKIVRLLSQASTGKQVRLIPVPWRAVWFGLKTLEAVGLKPGFRSDSVLSLAYQQEQPAFITLPDDIRFRDFEQSIRE